MDYPPRIRRLIRTEAQYTDIFATDAVDAFGAMRHAAQNEAIEAAQEKFKVGLESNLRATIRREIIEDLEPDHPLKPYVDHRFICIIEVEWDLVALTAN